MQNFIKMMLQTNLNHLVSQIENRFNTKVYEFGIAEQGSDKFNDLAPLGVKNSPHIGYLAIPVDEDSEYIITKEQRKNYDLSDFQDSWEAMQNIISVNSVKDYIQNAFQGRVYAVKAVKCSNLPVSSNTLEVISDFEDANYLYLAYAVG